MTANMHDRDRSFKVKYLVLLYTFFVHKNEQICCWSESWKLEWKIDRLAAENVYNNGCCLCVMCYTVWSRDALIRHWPII